MRRAWCLWPLLVLAVLAAWLVPGTEGRPEGPAKAAGPSLPWALEASADGRRVFAACEDARRVLVLDTQREAVASIPLDGGPRRLALSPDGATLAVSLGRENKIALVDVASRRVRRTLACPLAPEGLAFDADATRLFVARRLGRDVAVLDIPSGRMVKTLPAGEEPFALEPTATRDAVIVVSRRAERARPDAAPYAVVTVIDTARLEVRHRVRLPSVHMAESLAVTPDGSRALIPAIRVRNLLPIVQVARGWVLSGVMGIVDLERGVASVLPLNESDRGFADPTAIALSRDGTTAWVASGSADTVARIDVPALLAVEVEGRDGTSENFGLTPRYLQAHTAVGRYPCGLVRTERGVAVAERLQGRITLLPDAGAASRLFTGGGAQADPELLAGERAFHDASFCFQDAFSCRSCHPEAHTDGLTYDFEIDGVGRHVVLNRSLRGLAGTAPYKWTGINPSLQRQCGARFAMVLTRAAVMPPATLDAMAAWLESLPPPRALVDSEGAEADLVARGRAIFERSRRKDGRRLRPSERCITCHPPPHYTNRQRTDVGSYAPGDPVRAFDVPHLTGVGQKAPYLHDGRATTLDAIFEEAGLGDRHGVVSDLDEADRRALVAFLRSL